MNSDGRPQPVSVDVHLPLACADRGAFQSRHYAFLATDDEFDSIFGRIKEDGVTYGSGPRSLEDMEINHPHTGRGVYFRDPNGHVMEVITHTYI